MSGNLTDSNSTYGNDESLVIDILNGVGLQGAISVTNVAIEAKVGATILTSRKTLTVMNNGTAIIYWGYTNAVTASTGTPIYKKQVATWGIGDNLQVFLIAASGTHNCRVTEAS
jgi:hypothetical protein